MSRKSWTVIFGLLVVAMAGAYFFSKSTPDTPLAASEQDIDIVESQKSIEQALYKDYEQDTYTFSEPYVALDPYGVSPLSGVVLYEAEENDNITVTVPGDSDIDTISYEYSVEEGRAEIPIIGLYPNRLNNVEIENSSGDITQVQIETEPLPEDFSEIEVVTSKPEEMAEGLTLLSHFSQGLFAIDPSGNVRWWINDSPTFGYLGPVEWMENGNMLILGGNMVPQYYMQSVYEIDYLGKIYREYELPANSGHHEIRVLPGGSMLVAIGAPDKSTKEDHIIEIDMDSGKVVKLTNLKDCIPMPDYIGDPVYLEAMVSTGMDREAAEASLRTDWFHNNGFYYDETDGALILSARVLDAIFKIDYASGELIWVLTDPEAEWAKAPSMKEKLLTPIGEEFEYIYGQHSVSVLPAGDILVFDNGCYRSKEWDSIIDDNQNYSRAVRYRVNEEDMTVEQIWQYGKERGNELLSCYVSNVEHLGDEHYLINFGGQIYGQDGIRSSSNMLPDAKSATTIVEVNNNDVVYEVKIQGTSENTYRAYRREDFIPLP